MINNKIKFSIIIPTYNRSSFIKRSIESVLHQTYSDFELIVVDDGSTDNTEEIVKSIADTRVQYYKKENEERGAARNYGCSKAKGNYITFFDSDDILHSNHLSEASKTIEKIHLPEWFHLGYTIVDEKGSIINSVKAIQGNLNIKLISGNFLSCNGVFLKQNVAQEFKFNEDRRLSAIEDWELWLRIASKYKLYHSEVITSSIINHDTRSVINTNIDSLINRFNLFLVLVLNNQEILNYYKGKLHLFKSSCYTYISLHLALTKKNKIIAIKYLLKGLLQNPLFLFERRFLAIIKHLLF